MKRSSSQVWVLAAVFVVLMLSIGTSASPVKRSGPNSCSRSASCGWYVYTSYTRIPEYHVHGTCTCPSGTKCARFADDLVSSAFIYRCLNGEDSRGKKILPANPKLGANHAANES